LSDIPKKTVPEVSAPIVRTQTVATIGTEQGYPLSDLEFSILVRGEQASGDQGLSAAAWGVFATAVATLIAIYLTFTTDDIVRKGTTAIMLFYALVGIAVTSLAAIVLASLRLRMIRRDPVYHNLIAKIRRILRP
jgi:hypothetical protein